MGLETNVPIESILEGLKIARLTENRMDIIETKKGIKIINDTYNACYDAMKAGLEYLRGSNVKRRMAILGNIVELGEYTKEIHEKIGEEAYKNNMDFLIVVGDNARYMAKRAISLGMDENNVFMFNTNEEAIKKAKEIVKEGDGIFLKASNIYHFDQIAKALED